VAQVSSGSDSQCCVTVQNEVASLRTDVQSLKQEIPVLVNALNQTTSDLQTTRELAESLRGEKDSLLEMLHRLQTDLNNTQSQSANLLATAANEIRALRQDLTNMTAALYTCQAALGVVTGESVKPVSLSGDVQLSYCSFHVLEDCGYKRLVGGTSFYQLTKGSSSLSGPSVEHSTGIITGSYIGLDMSKEIDSNTHETLRVATIESELFQPANDYCIFFWYSMRGSDVKQLDVNVRIGGGTGYPVFSKTGDQKSDWLLGQVDLDSEYTSRPFKIDFVASTNAYKSYSNGYYNHYQYGDIGIDDVYVYNTSCANIPKCPPSSVKNTQNNVTSCYTFHATPLTWAAAYDVCRREGPFSALVSIETQQEQTFLVQHIKNDQALTVLGQNGFYTSGSDVGNEHSFKWTDTGSPRPVTWTAGWHAGQPNNVGGNQNCLLMQYPADGYTWGDIECDSQHPFICEVYYHE
ncbi:C-type lectin domain 4 member E, partial [Bulinus truncatus]